MGTNRCNLPLGLFPRFSADHLSVDFGRQAKPALMGTSAGKLDRHAFIGIFHGQIVSGNKRGFQRWIPAGPVDFLCPSLLLFTKK